MRRAILLLLIASLSSCFGKTSRDLPRDEEAVENFRKHRQTLEQIKDLVLSDPKYEESNELEDLLEESNCSRVSRRRGDRVLITYFEGGTILSSSELLYIYMEPFHSGYGDTIPMSLSLKEEVYKEKLKDSKLKPLGGGWYLCLNVE